ncbi:ABC transporter permease [Microbacterium sp. X-17]|uniref:ABC transporter permease n=1 Tax=Microbacterium sp. X-17 TaxID=3144404 RepID=UPI0031F4E14F
MAAATVAATPPRARSVAGDVGRGVAWVLIRISVPVILIVLWEIAAQSARSLWFPPPSAIVAEMYRLWLAGPAPLFFTPAVFADILPSVGRMLAGLAVAIVVGIVLGVVIGRSRFVSATTEPIIHFLRSTPGPALLPVFLLLLGTETPMRIVLIAFAALWPILLNTIDGVRGVDPTQLETARAFGLPPFARVIRVLLPAALPRIFAGIAIALAVSLTLMVVSELTVATDGIGYQIQRATQVFQMTAMWAGILLIAVLGVVLNTIFELIERGTLRWYRGSKRHHD